MTNNETECINVDGYNLCKRKSFNGKNVYAFDSERPLTRVSNIWIDQRSKWLINGKDHSNYPGKGEYISSFGSGRALSILDLQTKSDLSDDTELGAVKKAVKLNKKFEDFLRDNNMSE